MWELLHFSNWGAWANRKHKWGKELKKIQNVNSGGRINYLPFDSWRVEVAEDPAAQSNEAQPAEWEQTEEQGWDQRKTGPLAQD